MSHEETPFDFEGMPVSVKKLGAALRKSGAEFEYSNSGYRSAVANNEALKLGRFTPEESDKAAKRLLAEAAEIEDLKASVISDLQSQYNNTFDPNEKTKIAALIARVQACQGKEALAVIAEAQAALGDSNGQGAPETIDKKKERLWGEIDRNNQTIANASSHVDKYKTPEDIEEEKRIQKALADAKAEAAAAKTDEEKQLAQQHLETAQQNANQFYSAHAQEWHDKAVKAKDEPAITATKTIIEANNSNTNDYNDIHTDKTVRNTESAQLAAAQASPTIKPPQGVLSTANNASDPSSQASQVLAAHGVTAASEVATNNALPTVATDKVASVSLA